MALELYYAKCSKKNQFVESVPVAKSKDGNKLALVAAEDLNAIVPIEDNNWNIEAKKNITADITAPIKQGQVLGSVEYIQNGVSIGKIDLIAAKNMDVNNNLIFSKDTKSFFGKGLFSWILKLLLLLYLILIARKHIKRAIRRKKRRKYMESDINLVTRIAYAIPFYIFIIEDNRTVR